MKNSKDAKIFTHVGILITINRIKIILYYKINIIDKI